MVSWRNLCNHNPLVCFPQWNSDKDLPMLMNRILFSNRNKYNALYIFQNTQVIDHGMCILHQFQTWFRGYCTHLPVKSTCICLVYILSRLSDSGSNRWLCQISNYACPPDIKIKGNYYTLEHMYLSMKMCMINFQEPLKVFLDNLTNRMSLAYAIMIIDNVWTPSSNNWIKDNMKTFSYFLHCK